MGGRSIATPGRTGNAPGPITRAQPFQTQAERAIAAEGVVVETPRGFKQKNPAVNIGNEAARLMERAASHFGLSPGSRGRVTAVPHHRRRRHPLLGGAAARDDFAELIGEDPAAAYFG